MRNRIGNVAEKREGVETQKRLIVRYGQPFYGSSYMSEMKICVEIT